MIAFYTTFHDIFGVSRSDFIIYFCIFISCESSMLSMLIWRYLHNQSFGHGQTSFIRQSSWLTCYVFRKTIWSVFSRIFGQRASVFWLRFFRKRAANIPFSLLFCFRAYQHISKLSSLTDFLKHEIPVPFTGRWNRDTSSNRSKWAVVQLNIQMYEVIYRGWISLHSKPFRIHEENMNENSNAS